MPILRVALGLALAYVALVVLGWLFQNRLAFPAPRSPVPNPQQLGMANGERLELGLGDGTTLVGWYLRPLAAGVGPARALLWFYGNGENLGRIWPVLQEFQPPGTALLAVDYPGYGESGGSATEGALYIAGDAAYRALADRLGMEGRIFIYGRSLGTAVAIRTAAAHPAAGLILESPFTNAREMARLHYPAMPSWLVRLRLDNVATIRHVRCPVLIFHGDADRLVPIAMGRRVAEAAPGPVELVTIHQSGHNDTYDVGGREYRDRIWAFVTRPSSPVPRP
ncbi:MAG TPA: alpha/beta hydrolase [Gemmatimonadales bacterium]|nr:alpha/beta hydrolase [Gemmatimonadales bacterium]